MDNSTSIDVVKCAPAAMGNSVIILTLIILPFHILLIKVLLVDLRLALPRHMITLCLSISDTSQILMAFLCLVAVQIFSLTAESEGCYVVRCVLCFSLAMTIAATSLSLILLSVERYVACIHCFHLHQIFTRERTTFGISCIWVIGAICGAVAAAAARKSQKKLTLDENLFLKILLLIFAIPTSCILLLVQYRLFSFSWAKLRRVRPGTMIGSELEMADLRKKQVKISFIASIVVILYVISMFPAGCLSLIELVNENILSAEVQGILRGLTFLNNFADPYIYGLGIVDTRKAVIKNLRKMRNFFYKIARNENG